MFFPGREGQRMRGYPGGGVLVFPVLLPGDHLHLAVNCSATVFSSLSQFSYSTSQGIFLASPCPVSTKLTESSALLPPGPSVRPYAVPSQPAQALATPSSRSPLMSHTFWSAALHVTLLEMSGFVRLSVSAGQIHLLRSTLNITCASHLWLCNK